MASGQGSLPSAAWMLKGAEAESCGREWSGCAAESFISVGVDGAYDCPSKPGVGSALLDVAGVFVVMLMVAKVQDGH
jgi:hypothetical protein